MDDLLCNGEVVHQTLRELDFINHWLGGNQVTLSAIKKVWTSIPKEKKLKIADLGCGSGEMLKLILKEAEKEGREVELIGIDANPHIIAFAQRHCAGISQISFQCADVFSSEFTAQSFDITLATLFIHHFTHKELVTLFLQLKKQSAEAIIINDLHRHFLAYHSIRILTGLFSKSSMVKFDAPLSVARAFLKEDLITTLREADILQFKLTWKWAFRWQLIVPCGS